MCTARGLLPLPPSFSHGVRSPFVLHSPRPFQPAFGSSIRPSKPLAKKLSGYGILVCLDCYISTYETELHDLCPQSPEIHGRAASADAGEPLFLSDELLQQRRRS